MVKLENFLVLLADNICGVPTSINAKVSNRVRKETAITGSACIAIDLSHWVTVTTKKSCKRSSYKSSSVLIVFYYAESTTVLERDAKHKAGGPPRDWWSLKGKSPAAREGLGRKVIPRKSCSTGRPVFQSIVSFSFPIRSTTCIF